MIKTNRLHIRKFKKDDYKDLYEYLSLETTYIYEPGEPIDIDTAKKMAKNRSETDSFYAVELKSERKLIGHIYFQQTSQKELMTWEVGYIFNPNYQKMGYATESVKAIIEYALDNWRVHRVVGHCNPDNISSWKLLERIGMQREGTLRKNIFFRRDKEGFPIWCNTYEYAILKEDLRS